MPCVLDAAKKKFLFVGKSNFCGKCLETYCDLVCKSSDLSCHEVIPGFLADMHDCLSAGETDVTTCSEALKNAITNSLRVKRAANLSDVIEKEAIKIAQTLAHQDYMNSLNNLQETMPFGTANNMALEERNRKYKEHYREACDLLVKEVAKLL